MGRLTFLLSLLLAASTGGGERLPSTLPVRGFEPREVKRNLSMPEGKADELRQDALARAKVWNPPEPSTGRADLGRSKVGLGPVGRSDALFCKFHPEESGGATPKFACVFQNGDVLKVKYGNAEVHTEVAASRLLEVLGFGADRMHFVKTVRCFGCPEDPYTLLSCISSPFEAVRRECESRYGERSATGAFTLKVDYAKYVDFTNVAIEERKAGKAIQGKTAGGWGFDELDKLQARGGGDTRAHRDALRLMAVFLNNWDNRPDNQRLICLAGGEASQSGQCSKPFAYMHDVGGTFGRVGGESKQERKFDVEGWGAEPVWTDPKTCRVRIKAPILHGASFNETAISEGGRRFLAQRLRLLSERQIRDLFEGAGFGASMDGNPANKDLGKWVKAFKHKVAEIADRPPCPAS